MEAGKPYGIGPGAPNDIERLESGLVSFGADCRYQDYPANPFEMGLGKLVHLDRADDFVGKAALKKIASQGVKRRRTGFFIDGRPLRGNQAPLTIFYHGEDVGILSEMAFSKRLGRNIGVGLIATHLSDGLEGATVRMDGIRYSVTPTPLPFIS
jgi:aminomethyltransferase